MGLEVGRVDHHGLPLAVLSGQTGHHPGEDTLIAPALPTVVERLVWTIGFRGVPPTQPVAIDENNSTQHASIINARLAVGLWKKGRKTRDLRIR